ncbi:hypothetical protein ACM66T_07525 [Sulfurimonas sp. ST-25]|uniref:hypothetical protein n=1 Tax=Sulfurimonas sp. ST-25 TaxID=3400151 RepID=UPI003A86B4A2
MTKFRLYVDSLPEINEIPHIWDESNLKVIFLKSDEGGFDISVSDDGDDIIGIETDMGIHDHIHIQEAESYEKALSFVFGLVRDMLSENMRIREITKNEKPVKWILENYQDGKWFEEHTVGLLLFNYFGKKSEKVYSNHTLPPRKIDDSRMYNKSEDTNQKTANSRRP